MADSEKVMLCRHRSRGARWQMGLPRTGDYEVKEFVPGSSEPLFSPSEVRSLLAATDPNDHEVYAEWAPVRVKLRRLAEEAG